jgi:predicted DNA-binding transcriptional regulator YafY
VKLDRLLGILTVLLQNERVTAPQLAERFEVSRRTVSRDIDALCMAGIPVVARQGGGGGLSIAPGYKLDKSVLTEGELASIVAALKGLGSVTEKSALERTLDKLTGKDGAVVRLPASIVIDLASHYRGSLTEKIELIRRAIRESRLIAFDYYSEKGKSRRVVEPCFLAFQWTAGYVLGYCRERKDFRMFKLARLWEPEMLAEPFAPRPVPPQRMDFSASFPDKERLVALFEPSVRYQLIETYGPDSFAEEGDGRLRLEIGYTNYAYTLSWVLGFGDRATVLEPRRMAQDIRRIAQNLAARYEP